MNPITKINGIDIVSVEKDGETYLPIKPICDAIGIDFPTQYGRIKNDEILSSVVGLRPTTGADGKQYEMMCLPIRYVFGWLFLINPKNVSAESRPAVITYRCECYDVLWSHFVGAAKKAAEQSRLEADLLRERGQLLEQSRVIKTEIREIDEKLTALSREAPTRNPHYSNQPV